MKKVTTNYLVIELVRIGTRAIGANNWYTEYPPGTVLGVTVEYDSAVKDITKVKEMTLTVKLPDQTEAKSQTIEVIELQDHLLTGKIEQFKDK